MTANTQSKAEDNAPRIFDMTNQECLWSKARVVPPRQCHNAFDCLSCSFDQAMQVKKKRAALAQGKPTRDNGTWTYERWQATPAHERYCRHMLSDRVSHKLCINEFNCAKCAYDQNLDDAGLVKQDTQVPLTAVAGLEMPTSYYFHSGHTWARLEYGGRVRVGLDDLAARLFGPADEFRLPELGSAVRGNGPEVGFSRQGRQARAASPVEGVVVAQNPKAIKQPSLANQEPYGQGWLLLLEPTRLQRDLKGLKTGEQGLDWMEREAARLAQTVGGGHGWQLAATGGRVLSDVFGAVPGLDWNQLTKDFLAG